MTSTVYPIESAEKEKEEKKEGTGTNGAAVHKGARHRGTIKFLGIVPIKSPIRQCIIQMIKPGSTFDTIVLVMIVLNSLTMACTDYRYVDESYAPDPELSARNRFVEKAEVMFNGVFVSEFVLKVVSQGLIMGEDAYLRNHWNKFDFVVVLCSIIAMFPVAPNLSVLRSFRVLRPLRSVSKLPGLRKIVGALVDSLGDLSNVMLLLGFILASFSITGILFWRGLFHARCRLTPFPVRMPSGCRNVTDPCWDVFIADAIMHPAAHRCIDEPNDDLAWNQATSTWFVNGPQDCIWPLDETDARVCSLLGGGCHICEDPLELDDGLFVNRTCGSNYDAFGNPRFVDTLEPYGIPRMKSGVYAEELNWGFTNYDDFLSAFVTTFQVVSLEGWTDIMYWTIDAWSVGPSILIFVALIVIGGYIVLNLVLAVITSSLDRLDGEERKRNSTDATDEHVKKVHTKTQTGVLFEATRELLEGRQYPNFIMGCIVFNTAVMSLDHYGISSNMEDVLETANFVFTVVFFIDMALCNMAYGIKSYWSKPGTAFDGCVVLSSIVELAVLYLDPGVSQGPSSFSIFRSLRLFRIFKMARNWKSLHSLLTTINETLVEIGNFGVLLLLFVLTYALIGMQIFSNRMRFDPNTGAAVGISDPGYEAAMIPRSHFNNLFWAMTTIFQVLSGENWNSVMYDGWRAISWPAVVYFLSLMIFGVFIVMNLFLAILLKEFDNNEELVGTATPNLGKTSRLVATLNKIGTMWKPTVSPDLDIENASDHDNTSSGTSLWQSRVHKNGRMRAFCYRLVQSKYFDSTVTVLIILSSICLALDNPLSNPNSAVAQMLRRLDLAFSIMFIAEMMLKVAVYGPKQYLENAWNLLDLMVVGVSILDVANVGEAAWLRVLRTLRVLRPLRMINRLPELKLVADALALSIPSVGNVAVLCVLFYFIFAIFGVTYLKGTFYHCDPRACSSLSPDQMHYLTYPRAWGTLSAEEQRWFDVESMECHASDWDPLTIPTSKEICDCLVPGGWSSVIPQNFNNVLSGAALLFEISTTEGWVDVMYAAIDQRGIDAQPVRDNNVLWAIFFILFLVVGAFFVLELFVGVTVENFAKIRDQKGRGLMTEAQREWASTQAFVMKIKPEKRIKRPTGAIRSWCYDFIMPSTNPRFDPAITSCIILNCICTASVKFGDSVEKQIILNALNVIFAALFAAEVAIKIIALSSKYFLDGWNRFDFTIVCGSSIGLLMSVFVPEASSITAIIRLFRIGRLFRLIKSIKTLRSLFNAMITAIPSIINIGSLLFLLFFIYAVCGVQLFSRIAYSNDLNKQANFRSFGNAMLLLLRFSTGENWNGFMRNLMLDTPDCIPQPIYDADSPWCLGDEDDQSDCTEINGCGAGISAFLYFYSFTLLVTFVVLNLFVGVVLEAFESSNEGDILNPTDLEHFTSVWAIFDPDATWCIHVDSLKDFLSRLEPPLGIGNQISGGRRESSIDRIMSDSTLLEIPVTDEGQVNIVHVATHLAKRLAKEKHGDEFNELDDDHPIQRRILLQRRGMHKTLREVYDLGQSRKKLKAIHAFKLGKRPKIVLPPRIDDTHSGMTEQEQRQEIGDRSMPPPAPPGPPVSSLLISTPLYIQNESTSRSV